MHHILSKSQHMHILITPYIYTLYNIHTSSIAALALELSGRIVERHAGVGRGGLVTSEESCAHMEYSIVYEYSVVYECMM